MGLTHGFGQNMAIFPCLIFRQYMPGKFVLQYSRTKKAVFQPIKTKGLKSRKIEIFEKGLTHSFGQKMAIFPCFFFSGNIGQENVFYNILERKNAFLAFKNNTFKNSKIEIFPKGLTYDFGQKMAIFPCFFFRQYRPGKCVLQYSRTKNAFQAYKNNRFKKSKN